MSANSFGREFTTRFAPAPTGFLHLGHVANALCTWGLARRHGGRVLLRIEDHDRTRCRPEFEAALLEDLEWLGFAPDAPLARQSERGTVYERAIERLAALGLVYVCDCSRSAIHETLPVEPGGELCYPGTCRSRGLAPSASAMRRVRFDRLPISFDDLRLGPQLQTPADQCGDLLARDRNGHWTYQFAAVVDDMEQSVDMVIRGEDLLDSTGRQIQLASLLGRPSPPRFYHHALIRKPGGAKLSKSDRDTGVRDLRAAGLSAARVRGLAAAAAGLLDSARDLSLSEVSALFADTPRRGTAGRDEIEFSTDPSRLDVALIHRWLSTSSYWAKGRAPEVVARSIEHSLCFGAYAPNGAQVGFARVVTDYATFAWLCDVFVLEAFRGRGIAKRLVEEVVAHPKLLDLRRFLLATADAHELYRRYGNFEPLARPERWMERFREQ